MSSIVIVFSAAFCGFTVSIEYDTVSSVPHTLKYDLWAHFTFGEILKVNILAVYVKSQCDFRA